MTLVKSLFVWLLFIPCAILNGLLRESVLLPLLGEPIALPVSGLLLCTFIYIISWWLLPKLGTHGRKTFVWIGLLWSLLTVAFETILGLATGSSVHELLSAYDITKGNLWAFVVLLTGIAPSFVAHKKKLVE